MDDRSALAPEEGHSSSSKGNSELILRDFAELL